jgi:hypothetical protein
LDNFRDVFDLYGFTVLKGYSAFLEMGDTVWAGGCQDIRIHTDSLFQSQVGKPFTLYRFHPDPATPSAATKAVFQRIGHLDDFQTGYFP